MNEVINALKEIAKIKSNINELEIQNQFYREQLKNYAIVKVTKPNIVAVMINNKKYQDYLENQKKIKRIENIKKNIENNEHIIEELSRKINELNEKLKNINSNNRIKINDILMHSQMKLKNEDFLMMDDTEFNNIVGEEFQDNFSIDDIMLVHATNYFPKDFMIRTNYDANVTSKNEHAYEQRRTTHFALNGKVSSHNNGNWQDRKIIILEPMKYHIDQIDTMIPADTYTYGSVKLSNEAIILINQENFEEIYKENKDEIDKYKDKIVLFSGDSKIVVDNLLYLLGYKPQGITSYAWDSEYNSKLIENYFEKNFPKIPQNPHFGTAEFNLEKGLSERNAILNTDTYNYVDTTKKIEEEMKKSQTKEKIITPKELLKLYKYSTEGNSEYIPLEKTKFKEDEIAHVLKRYGIYCIENEIHIMDEKKAIINYKQPSKKQIKKVRLILEKEKIIELNEYKKFTGQEKEPQGENKTR